MLKTSQHGSIAFEPAAHQQGWLVLEVDGRRHRIRPLGRAQFRAIKKWSGSCPQRIGNLGAQSIWWYRGDLYAGETRLNLREVERQLTSLVA